MVELYHCIALLSFVPELNKLSEGADSFARLVLLLRDLHHDETKEEYNDACCLVGARNSHNIMTAPSSVSAAKVGVVGTTQGSIKDTSPTL